MEFLQHLKGFEIKKSLIDWYRLIQVTCYVLVDNCKTHLNAQSQRNCRIYCSRMCECLVITNQYPTINRND